MKALTVFVLHPSELLTDHVGNGDGLIANGFLRGLAARGHTLHVAYERIDLVEPMPVNVHLHPVPLTMKRGALRRLEYMLRVRALYERLSRLHGFDVIYQTNPVFTPLSLAMLGCKAPVVLGTYVPHWPERARNAPLRRLGLASLARLQQHFAASLLVTTPAALTRISSARSIREKVTYLQHAVDDAFLEVRAQSLDATNPHVLFVGSVERKKGIFTLLDAFERVNAVMPEARLRVVGDGAEMERVRARVGAMQGAASNVSLDGAVERAKIPEIVAACDVLCLPSYGEPYGNVVLEAMACGKPVVTTNSGAFPHFVPDAGGKRVAEGDVTGLGDALLEVLGKPSLRRTMGEVNRERIHARHTWRSVIEQLESALGATAAGHAR